MAEVRIRPARSIRGSLALPGDKSISHRYAILAGLARGSSEIRNFSAAVDCRSTLDCLRALGVGVEVSELPADPGQKAALPFVRITGRPFAAPAARLDAGNSGTTLRLLAGVLSGQPLSAEIDGDSSLRRRPMRRIIEPLERMGARILAREGQFAPLKILGAPLKGIHYELPVPSAQVKSAVLLAGLDAEGDTSITEPVPTRDHTELALTAFGVEVERTNHIIRVRGGGQLHPQKVSVPGDISAGIFFLAAALLLPEASLVLQGVGLNPTRSAVLDFLTSMGAPISILSLDSAHGELVGDVAVRSGPLQGGIVAGTRTAAMIDELPMLAALAPYTEQGIEIRDAGELRVKESDRISAMVQNLRRMGAEVIESPEGLRVSGSRAGHLKAAELEAGGDHRIAMALAVAALGAEGETIIRGAECVAVSFPGFFDSLERLVER